MKTLNLILATMMLVQISLPGCSSGNKTNTDKCFIVPFTPSRNLEADFQNPPDYARPRAYWWWLEGYMTRQGVVDDLTAMKEAGIMGAIVFDAGSSGYYDGKRLTYHNSVFRTASGPGFMTPEWRDLFGYACHVADSFGIEMSLNITSGWNDGGPWVTPEYASQKLVWSETVIDGGQTLDMQLPLPEKLLTYQGTNQPYFKPVAVLAMKLAPDADSVKPLPHLNIKAVHSIAIPQTPNGLGFDWETFVRPLPDDLQGCHARLDDVTDISKYVDAEGRLQWDVPSGRYAILRFGHTGTGVRVSTHSPGAGGLAIDYLNASAMDLQFNNVVIPLLEDLKKMDSKSLRYLHDDSWELGAANWTPLMEKAFAEANGYGIRKYLPVIAGKIIESHDMSERFLYDFRRTIADLIAANHYRRFKELSHAHNIGIHPESGGPHPAPIDALKNMGQSDIPMGEFWAISGTHRVVPHSRLYVKQGASAAHIYGKRFMQAEGPSSVGPHWERDPWMLKPTMDRVFCEGLNRFVIHTFTHSPKEAGLPGNEYFAGTHLNPNTTWWKQGKAFLDWSARNSFMLSQGLFVADVAFYYGDNVPNQAPLKNIDPRLGEGYDYDVVNSDVILNRMSVRNEKIVLPDGMSYHILVLPERNAMNVEVLEKIEQLVKAGATVFGTKPETTVGLRNMTNAQKRLDKIAGALWGKIDGTTVTENVYGKGKVVWYSKDKSVVRLGEGASFLKKTIRETLENKGVVSDFTYARKFTVSFGGENPCTVKHEFPKGRHIDYFPHTFDYIHRSIPDIQGNDSIHIYYVANRLECSEFLQCCFRVTGLQPEIWYPETGKTVPVNVYIRKDGHTCLPLHLDPLGSMFVVFRHAAQQEPVTAVKLDGTEIFPEPVLFDNPDVPFFEYLPDGNLSFCRNGVYTLTQGGKETEIVVQAPNHQEIKGSWQVSFDPAWGVPTAVNFPKLISWTEHSHPDVKYYSGTAVYHQSFALSGEVLKKYRIRLNLGELHHLAEVRINGKSAGVWWKKPFAGDITDWVHAGENTLEVAVVNLWPNRLIGDQFLPENQRRTKTNVAKFDKDSPLLPSGLLGPVWLSFGTK